MSDSSDAGPVTAVQGSRDDLLVVKVGVLALQGAFHEHEQCLTKAWDRLKQERHGLSQQRLQVREIRRADDVEGLHGIILPGGESTTMGILLQRTAVLDPLVKWIQDADDDGHVCWGTCAGLILLADDIDHMKKDGQAKIGGLPIIASRNMYGRQKESFVTELIIADEALQNCLGSDGASTSPGVFIRAPGIQEIIGDNVIVLATTRPGQGDSPVAVRRDRLMVTAFHPELTDDLRWHAYFLLQVVGRAGRRPTPAAST